MVSSAEYISLQPKQSWASTGERGSSTARLKEDSYSHDHQDGCFRSRDESWLSRMTTGSASGVLWVSLFTIIITLINLAFAIALPAAYPVESGIGEALVGNCSDVASWSRWLHIGINILSSGLLGASNYCMQRLCAPTRSEVDSEHAKGRWLDIGVPSVRNFRRISRGRKILWILLGLSSIPLHLFYNSAVFSTLAAQEFRATLVTEDFVNGGSTDTGVVSTASIIDYIPDLQAAVIANSSSKVFRRLDNADCIRKYSGNFVTDGGDLLAVTSADFEMDGKIGAVGVVSLPAGAGGNSIYFTGYAPATYTSEQPRVEGPLGHLFVCADQVKRVDTGGFTRGYSDRDCNVNGLLARPTSWRIGNARIEYCLSEIREEQCKLQFSVAILWLVVASNIVKLGCMLWILFRVKEHYTFVTIGDAVTSYLEDPDVTTEKQCLLSRDDVVKGRWRPGEAQLKSFERRASRWFGAASRRRWAACLILCLVTLILAITFLGLGVSTLRLNSITALWDMGFGSLRADSLVWPSLGLSLTGAVLLANLPQLIISFLYVLYNGLFTSMLVAAEWASFASKRQPLRVTNPRGDQISTYWLQLPYAYSVPILVAMTLLHWLVSQSIFLASIKFYRAGLELEGDDTEVMGCGYSCAAIIFAIVLGLLLVCALVGTSFRRYPGGIPLASTCSAAISAACHPPKDDTEAAWKELQWGVVSSAHGFDGFQEGHAKHCSFTSQEIEPPEIGHTYA